MLPEQQLIPASREQRIITFMNDLMMMFGFDKHMPFTEQFLKIKRTTFLKWITDGVQPDSTACLDILRETGIDILSSLEEPKLLVLKHTRKFTASVITVVKELEYKIQLFQNVDLDTFLPVVSDAGSDFGSEPPSLPIVLQTDFVKVKPQAVRAGQPYLVLIKSRKTAMLMNLRLNDSKDKLLVTDAQGVQLDPGNPSFTIDLQSLLALYLAPVALQKR